MVILDIVISWVDGKPRAGSTIAGDAADQHPPNDTPSNRAARGWDERL
jgi:hypothetical protein